MQMSQEGINTLLKPFEGCKLHSYRCPAGILTIGYGHTSAAGAPAVSDGMTISQQQADNMLRTDLVKYERAVEGMVRQPLTQHQFDVLVDFSYNAGIGNLESSTLLRKVNAGAFNDVPAELMKWTRGGGQVLPGLVRRRHAESAWWISDNEVASSADTQEPTTDEHESRTEPDAIPAPSMANSKQGNAALVTVGLGGFGAAKEVAENVQEASDTADQFASLLHNTNLLIMVAIIGLGAAIWYFRKKHMEKYDV